MKLITRPRVVYLLLTISALLALSCGGNKSLAETTGAKERRQSETIKNEVMPSASMNETLLTEAMPLEHTPTPSTSSSYNDYQSISDHSPFNNGPNTNSSHSVENYSRRYNSNQSSGLPNSFNNGTRTTSSLNLGSYGEGYNGDQSSALTKAYNNGTNTTSSLNLGIYSHGYKGPFPYYCDPTRYPAHIINAIAACKPFLGQINDGTIPWTDLFGSRNRYRDRLGDHYPNYRRYSNYDSDDDDGGLYDYDNYNYDDDDDRDYRDGRERRNGREERAWQRVHRNDR